jgi:hypothetical protein
MDSSLIIASTSAAAAVLSSIAVISGIFVTFKVHQNQKLLSQRQLLLPLWDHMSNLNKINPNLPVTPDIIKAVNTLELVALCCEGGMIDEKVIKRTFRDQFMMHYEDIGKCTSLLPGTTYDGKDLLKQNRAATVFYTKLNEEMLSADSIKKN